MTAVPLLLLLLAAACGAQYLPIPSVYPGSALGNPNAPIRLEEFGDYQCPYCGMAYPIVQQVLDIFGPNTIYYIFHAYPLWLHRQAYDAAKAAAVVATLANASVYWKYVDYAFANQGQIQNAMFYNKTEAQLVALLGQWVGNFGINYSTFFTAFNTSSAVTAYVNADIALSISYQIFETPTFVVNGFKTQFDETTTISEWVSFIKSLLPSTAATAAAAERRTVLHAA